MYRTEPMARRISQLDTRKVNILGQSKASLPSVIALDGTLVIELRLQGCCRL